MTYFLKSGNTFKPTPEAALDVRTTLPLGTYTIKCDPHGNLFFQNIDDFTNSGKRYGDNIKNTDRIFSTFMSRDVSTGIMLAGEKGSGKSLLAKSLAIKGYENNIPTIVVNEPWCGESFNQLIQSIEQAAIIIFDEFEKVYDKDDQEKILTLLDGVYPSKKLFVLTCNNKYKVDEHMRNRPGRIFYMIDFVGLSPDFITEYCEDNLNDKSYIDQICKLSLMFEQFNFDMLKALVEEMNRYNECPQDALKLLNVKPEFSRDVEYTSKLFVPDVEIVQQYNTSVTTNPLLNNVVIGYEYGEDERYNDALFKPTDIISMDVNIGEFVYLNTFGDKLILTRKKYERVNYFDAL